MYPPFMLNPHYFALVFSSRMMLENKGLQHSCEDIYTFNRSNYYNKKDSGQ